MFSSSFRGILLGFLRLWCVKISVTFAKAPLNKKPFRKPFANYDRVCQRASASSFYSTDSLFARWTHWFAIYIEISHASAKAVRKVLNDFLFTILCVSPSLIASLTATLWDLLLRSHQASQQTAQQTNSGSVRDQPELPVPEAWGKLHLT